MTGAMLLALVAGVVACAMLGAVSFNVVSRGLSFMGVGISHGAFAGVAASLLLGLSPPTLTYPVAVVLALAITWASERSVLPEDTLIGVFFPAFMALGILLVSVSGTPRQDVFGYLFGSILAVSPSAARVTLAVGAAILLYLLATLKEDIQITFGSEAARAAGIRVRARKYLFAAVLALSVVASVRVLGLILVEAFLVIPGAAARRVARGYRSMFLLSIGLGGVSACAGLAIAWSANLPPGASIVLTAALLYLLAGFAGPPTHPAGVARDT